MDKFFQTLARLASSSETSLAKIRKQRGIRGGRIRERGKKTFSRLASKLLFLLTKPELF
jgi:hypothetical protein